jgi:hypothetical protein
MDDSTTSLDASTHGLIRDHDAPYRHGIGQPFQNIEVTLDEHHYVFGSKNSVVISISLRQLIVKREGFRNNYLADPVLGECIKVSLVHDRLERLPELIRHKGVAGKLGSFAPLGNVCPQNIGTTQ